MPKRSIDDYFLPSAIKKVITSSSPQVKAEPCGLLIIDNFISSDEERKLLEFLDCQRWRTDLSRRTMHFGGTYCLMPARDASPSTRRKIEETILDAPAIAPELSFVIDRMIERGLYSEEERPEYCIVNEYLPGQGISAHVENFKFGEPVCSLTLAGADTMRFHQLTKAHDGSVRSGKSSAAPRTGKQINAKLEKRSLLVLTGDARSKWQHEIVRGRTIRNPPGWRRVSLTFRTLKTNGKRIVRTRSVAFQDSCNDV